MYEGMGYPRFCLEETQVFYGLLWQDYKIGNLSWLFGPPHAQICPFSRMGSQENG